METIGAFEAKTHLSTLLEHVSKGERFIITRHGMPVAQPVPVDHRDPEKIKAVVQRMEELSASLILDDD